MDTAGVITLIAVVLIVLALVYYLVSVIFALMKITNRAFEIELGKNDRAHHATVEIGGDELRHAVGVDRLEHALPDAFTNDPRQQFALLDVTDSVSAAFISAGFFMAFIIR